MSGRKFYKRKVAEDVPLEVFEDIFAAKKPDFVHSPDKTKFVNDHGVFGECSYCFKKISSRAMERHLLSCKERLVEIKNEKPKKGIFLIKATASPYFVYFEIDKEKKMKDLDSYLRDLWVECCWHLSAFTVGRNIYNFTYDGPDNESDFKLSEALAKGVFFTYEYDFGTTTKLWLKVVDERIGEISDVEEIAINEPIKYLCQKCGKKATLVCAQCTFDVDKITFCNKCAKKHECGEDLMLEIVNSPRTGMCGYTG